MFQSVNGQHVGGLCGCSWSLVQTALASFFFSFFSWEFGAGFRSYELVRYQFVGENKGDNHSDMGIGVPKRPCREERRVTAAVMHNWRR